MIKNNKIQSLSKCNCKIPQCSKIFEGICGTCFGNFSPCKLTRSHTPAPNTKPESFEDMARLKSKISEKAYIKTLKVMKLLKSVSGQSIQHKIQHRRSNTSNKPENKIFVIPEERSSINKINHAHTESHPNFNPASLSKVSFSRSILGGMDPLAPSRCINNSKSSNDRSSVHKSHDRALSSRVYKLSSSPIPELRFPSTSDPVEVIYRKSEEIPKYFSHECYHIGHRNSVSSVAFLQGRPFSAGSDYNIISWPRLDPVFQIHGQKINPISLQRAHPRRVTSLESVGGNILISAACHSKIKIWSLHRALTLVGTLDSQEPTTNTLMAASQRTLLSGGGQGTTKVWDIETRLLAKSYPEHSKSITSLVQIGPSTFLSGSQDCYSRLCDIRTSRSIAGFRHCGPVEAMIVWNDCYFYSAAEKIRVRGI